MVDTLKRPDKEVKKQDKPRPKKPRDVHILLYVCVCFSPESLTLVTARAEIIAQILRITVEDLRVKAKNAVTTRRPQVVGCYTPEVAETILHRLDGQTPFISRSCHEFFSQKT